MTPATPPLTLSVVTPFGSLGGSERWLLGLLDVGGDRVAAEVTMLQDGPLRAELEARGVPVRVLPTGPSGPAVARTAVALTRELRSSDADVLLANGVKAAAVAVPAARLAGVPVAWMKHDFSLDATLARPLGRLADLVLANSAAVAEATGRDDAVVVPPPRPSTGLRTNDEANAFWRDRGVPLGEGRTLAMVTRLVGYKGVDTAVATLAEAPARDWRLVVVGPDDPAEPDEPTRLRELAAELGVADRVHLVGEVTETGPWLGAFDAVAVLTRVDSRGFGREGYSMVALEALAAGVPLVGARQNPEVERMADAAGAVVDGTDPRSVAEALASLDDPEIRTVLAERARQLIAEHPDALACADDVVAALAGLAGRPGAGLAGPPLSVLTCFRNESGHVDEVVGRVLTQLGPDDEYLLLDDRSTDETRAELASWAAKDDRVRLLTGPGINLSAARNHGFGEARNPVVVCTDAGVAPYPGWLAALRAAFAETDPVDLVVGVYDVDGGDPRRDAARLALFPSVAEARRRTPLVRIAGLVLGRRFDARRLDGRSMACRVEAWRAVGGFDVDPVQLRGRSLRRGGAGLGPAQRPGPRRPGHLGTGRVGARDGPDVRQVRRVGRTGRVPGADRTRPGPRVGVPGRSAPAGPRWHGRADRRARRRRGLPRGPALPGSGRTRDAGHGGPGPGHARSQGRRQGHRLPARSAGPARRGSRAVGPWPLSAAASGRSATGRPATPPSAAAPRSSASWPPWPGRWPLPGCSPPATSVRSPTR